MQLSARKRPVKASLLIFLLFIADQTESEQSAPSDIVPAERHDGPSAL